MHGTHLVGDGDVVPLCRTTGCQRLQLCRYQVRDTPPPRIRTIKRGERIDTDETSGIQFRIVQSGVVVSYVIVPDGRRQILCFNLPGDVLSPLWAAGTESWCEALAESQICEVTLSTESERLCDDPKFAALMLRLAHERLARASAHVVALGRLDGMERLCGFLVEMARRSGRRRGGCWHVFLPMAREDIADYLGLNTATVSRLFTRIKKAGLARFLSPSEYEITSLARLEARVPTSLARGIHEVRPKGRGLVQ